MSAEWIEKIFTPAVIDEDEFILFCDNLDGQIFHLFCDKIRELGGAVIYGSPEKTPEISYKKNGRSTRTILTSEWGKTATILLSKKEESS